MFVEEAWRPPHTHFLVTPYLLPVTAFFVSFNCFIQIILGAGWALERVQGKEGMGRSHSLRGRSGEPLEPTGHSLVISVVFGSFSPSQVPGDPGGDAFELTSEG